MAILYSPVGEVLGPGDGNRFEGPGEVDETYMGWRRSHRSDSQSNELTGCRPASKRAVVGSKDRSTKQVAARVVTTTHKETLQGEFVKNHVAEGAKAYKTLPFDHDAVERCVQEDVKGAVDANGVARSPTAARASSRAS